MPRPGPSAGRPGAWVSTPTDRVEEAGLVPHEAGAKLVGGPAEPAGKLAVQVLLVVADPGDVPVGA